MLKNDVAAHSAFLANNGWLSHCAPAFSESFLAHCHWRTVPAGTGIQHAGDVGATISGLARGSLTMTTSLSTPDSPTIHVMHPGSWFGFIPLFIGSYRPNSMVARTDVTLAYLSQREVEALLASYPEWWRFIGTLAAIGTNVATSIAADMMIRDSTRRCAAALLQLAGCRHADPVDAEPKGAPLSQEELAAISNLSRTSISMILRELEETGLIALGYRTVTINDPARLRAMVDNV